MSVTLDRADEIVAAFVAQGVRATTDPSAANPPGVLVPPPHIRHDLNCGFTASWELVALAPAPTGANHTAWADLAHMEEVAAAGLPVVESQLVSINLAGVDYPAYLLRWTEALDPTGG